MKDRNLVTAGKRGVNNVPANELGSAEHEQLHG